MTVSMPGARALLIVAMLAFTSCRGPALDPPVAIPAPTSSPAQSDENTPTPSQAAGGVYATASGAGSTQPGTGKESAHSAQPPASGAATVKRVKSRGKPKFNRKSAVYDRNGPAYYLLQSARTALGHFPADSLGNIDWVAALDRGLIAPRASISGKGRMQSRTDDIVMRNTRDMPWVAFPHRQHTEWLACSNCHPRPFEAKLGGNEVNMDNIMRGKQCGLCHDRVAFSIFACERCHSVTHPGSPKPWW